MYYTICGAQVAVQQRTGDKNDFEMKCDMFTLYEKETSSLDTKTRKKKKQQTNRLCITNRKIFIDVNLKFDWNENKNV